MGFWDKFGGFDYEINNEHVIEAVKEAGYEVIEATDTQLFLDIDTEEQYELFQDRFDLFLKFFEPAENPPFSERPSISGPPGRHIIITLKEPMPILERIAWQACLGSDPKKEFNNLLGVHFGIPHRIVLFNRKAGQQYDVHDGRKKGKRSIE